MKRTKVTHEDGGELLDAVARHSNNNQAVMDVSHGLFDAPSCSFGLRWALGLAPLLLGVVLGLVDRVDDRLTRFLTP